MNKDRLNEVVYKIFKVWAIALFIALPVVLLAGTVIVKLPAQTVYATSIVSPMERTKESIPCENINSSVNTIEFTYDDIIETHTNDISVKTSTIAEPVVVIEPDVEALEEKYASIFDWMSSNKKCDFGVDQLKVLNKYTEKYEVPMELMLSIISLESGFVSTALSDYSTAAGYCQVIRGTAEGIYEDELEYGEYDIYNHDYIMTTNWELNFEIAVYLMKNNYEESYNSWEHAIYAYHGSSDHNQNLEYFQHINTRMYELFGLSIHEL